MNFIVPCLLGLEAPIAEELRNMDAENVFSENGRVLFSGDEHILARSNICSRYAERIQILVGEFEAHSFEELFQGTKNLPWEQWIGREDEFPVKGYSLNSDLFSVRDCQAIIKKAVVERLKTKYKVQWFKETGVKYQIQFSIMKNKVSLLIDTSGAGLHKRGYRPHANEAPIKETLAAAICYFARLRDFHTLYDPMCGSGTILTEGTMLVKNIAPGIGRSFSAEKWPQIPENIWKEERERARDLVKKDIPFKAFGSDTDRNAVSIAAENARNAGVGEYIDFSCGDVTKFSPKTDRGTVIINPPYGERLMDALSVQELYGKIGKVFEPKRGWSYYIITADEDFEKHFGRRADKRRKLYNGMIKCQLYMYFK
ncbi:MAG: class I SAM-dependent RNA methyltransferase [Clostridiales bacterium]|nr:class I SAM-dependent RNA methyltransferase [Clostridiales bacterium]